jgi:hypothetical protein
MRTLAFNFFLTADAILDWLYPGPGAQHQREDLHNDPLVRAVWELASGANPVELKRSEHPPQTLLAVELTGRAAQNYEPTQRSGHGKARACLLDSAAPEAL